MLAPSTSGLTEKANHYYKLFINWTNEKIKKTFVKRYPPCHDAVAVAARGSVP